MFGMSTLLSTSSSLGSSQSLLKKSSINLKPGPDLADARTGTKVIGGTTNLTVGIVLSTSMKASGVLQFQQARSEGYQ
jgi:hypothetical protein